MRVMDLMSRNAVTVSPQTSAAAARETLVAAGIDHLLVTVGHRVVGVITRSDLPQGNDELPVSELMSRQVVTIGPRATLRHAAGVMRGRAVGCLPVVDEGKVIGIVTTSDVLSALARGEVHAGPPAGRTVLRKRGPRKRSPVPV